jgi:putative transposase
MPWGLRRYYGTGGLHFITCSCYQRRQLLGTPERRDLLLDILERMRLRYRFVVVGYVVMPEHFHLLVSEPEIGTPSTVMQAIKLGFVRRVFPHPSFGKVGDSKDPTSRAKSAREMGHPGVSDTRPPRASHTKHTSMSNHIWQRRFYDFNLWSQRKEVEKLRYMHRNPVERGLVERPEDWNWSSFRAYACGEVGPVRVNDWTSWEKRIRSRVG